MRFHRKAERINVAAVWWPVLQIGILVLTAVLQVQSTDLPTFRLASVFDRCALTLVVRRAC